VPEIVRSRGGDYVVALPGSWTIIPLANRVETANAVSALVTGYVGRDDRRAQLRRVLREHVLGLAREARTADIEFLAVAPELVPGVPFGGALTTRTLPWPADAGPLTQPVRTVSSGDRESAGHVERMISVDYVVPTPVGAGLLLAFSVPEATVSAEAILPLFDTIVEAISWVDAGL